MANYHSLPKSLTAADSVDFLVAGSSFTSETHTLEFVVLSPTPVIFPAVAYGSDFRVLDAAGTISSTLTRGRHTVNLIWTAIAGGARTSEHAGTILCLPNPKVALTPSWAQTTLTKAEAAIQKLATTTNQSVDVDGQVYTKRNFKELCDFRDRMIQTVESELAEIGRATRRSGMKTIRTRFV